MRYLTIIAILVFSCSSKKDIIFIQDTSKNQDFGLEYKEITIKADDILRIKISSSSPEISALFSFNEFDNGTANIESLQVNGFLVNSAGFVQIPLLDPFYVEGLTLNQTSALIQKLLKEQEDVRISTVDVKIVNSYFTVLGEVNKPGRYNFLKNNLNIFQALGIAGDITINGKRNDIRVIRDNNGKINIKSLDITSSKIFSSENFQIFSGDIIIVNPNKARVKNAGIIGNAGNLLSVLSFVLSSIIVINAN